MTFCGNQTILVSITAEFFKAFWSVRYKKVNARRVVWILKASFVFYHVFTITDMTEISHEILPWFRTKISFKNETIIFRQKPILTTTNVTKVSCNKSFVWIV